MSPAGGASRNLTSIFYIKNIQCAMKLKPLRRDRPIVLNLSDAEMAALDALAKRRGQTKSGVLRQALRLYESLDQRVADGAKLVLEAPQKGEKSEVLLL